MLKSYENGQPIQEPGFPNFFIKTIRFVVADGKSTRVAAIHYPEPGTDRDALMVSMKTLSRVYKN